MRKLLILVGASVAASCTEGNEATRQPAAEGPLPYRFEDVTEASGLARFHQENGAPEKPFVVESFGAGVALFDPDGDGDLDAYLSNGGSLEPVAGAQLPADALYLNDGSGKFTDGTTAAGLGDTHWTTGVRVVDLDGDGREEMYLTNYGPNVLYHNEGDGTFADVTARAGVADPGWSTGASFFDFDLDGDLDLYVANYLEFDEETMLRERPSGTLTGRLKEAGDAEAIDLHVMKGPHGLQPSHDRFYLNEGSGSFRDASKEVGIYDPEMFGFQTVAFDVDLDGWIDLYVANDVVANLLWHNEEGERFTDKAIVYGLALSANGMAQAGMGVGVGDYDLDLLPDIYVTNFVNDYFTLYRGRSGGAFVDVTSRMGLNQPTFPNVGWGCGFHDFDSDGDLEIFVVNGHVYPQVDRLDLGTSYLQKNQLFELRDGRYAVPEGKGGPGFELAQASRGAAVGDIDGDGDLDLLIGNLDGPPALLRNEGPSGNWVKVRVVGYGQNRDAVGARIVLRVGEERHLRLVGSGGSFLSSSDPREHFGLGARERADELEVTWPDGRVDRFTDLEAGLVHTIERPQPDAAATIQASPLVGP